MSITVERLLHKANVYHVTLIAGEEGLNHLVSWFHMVENITFAGFIEEQSLVFTTGIALGADLDLYTLIKAQIAHNASGTLLNLGPYIHEVPQDVVALCNAKKHPLLVCPWEVRIPDIMKLFSNLLLDAEATEIQLHAALQNAISFPGRRELYADTLHQYGFQESGFYTLGVIKPDTRVTLPSPEKVKQMALIIERILMSSGDKSFVVHNEGEFILLLCNYKEAAIIKITDRIMSALLPHWDTFYLGLGSSLQGLEQISQSYRQAMKMMMLHRKQQKPNYYCLYRDLGLYKLFFAIEDSNVLEEYYHDCLDPLEEQDRKKDTKYLEVLKLYLESNGSVNDTAEAMFLHRNTVNYKIRKIEEMLHCNLSNVATRSKLYIALCLKDILM